MTLPDLLQIREQVREQGKIIDSSLSRTEFSNTLKEKIKEIWPYDVILREGRIEFATSSSRKPTAVSNQNILKAAAAVSLYQAMVQYRNRVIQISREMGLEKDFRESFAERRSATSLPKEWKKWLKAVKAQSDLDDDDKTNLERFMIEPDSLTEHKGLNRGDWFEPAITKTFGLAVANNSTMAKLTPLFADNPSVYQSLIEIIHTAKSGTVANTSQTGGINIIVYGAPGTGKSRSIMHVSNSVRTVFHSDYRNSDFVGSYKPYKQVDEDGTENITYRFIPGPFISAFVNALKKPYEEHSLIIEEINRGNAASIFGEVFQLLDRSESGESEYHIDVEQSLNDFLREELGELWKGKLFIPSNLSLRASMNSADQGVEPMDSAFKRRWEFRYIPLRFDASDPLLVKKCIPYKSNLYSWAAFASAINIALMDKGVEEDRLLGPYFLSRRELTDTRGIETYVRGKVLIYLWDDVLRHVGRQLIFRSNLRSFSDVQTAFTNGDSIFTDGIDSLLQDTNQKYEDETNLERVVSADNTPDDSAKQQD